MPESLFAAIDNYCERTGPELWSEPLNAVTNLSFILAGIYGLLLCRRNGSDSFTWFLCWWVIVIGVGSALFHTFANGLTLYGDVLPIAAFILFFTWFVVTRLLALPTGVAAGIVIAFYVAAEIAVLLVPDSMRTLTHGTTGYLPALLALLFFGGWLAARGHPASRYLFAGAGVFVISAAFRSIDGAVCDYFAAGTHFLWHTLNGVLLGILVAAAVKFDGPVSRPLQALAGVAR